MNLADGQNNASRLNSAMRLDTVKTSTYALSKEFRFAKVQLDNVLSAFHTAQQVASVRKST